MRFSDLKKGVKIPIVINDPETPALNGSYTFRVTEEMQNTRQVGKDWVEEPGDKTFKCMGKIITPFGSKAMIYMDKSNCEHYGITLN